VAGAPASVRASRAVTTDRGEQTRRHILAVAARMFAECGYAGTSLNDIVRESGLTKGAFYFHFASKEALALAVFRDMQERMTERLLQTAGGERRALDQMIAMLRDRCTLLEQERSYRSMGKLCGELGRQPQLSDDMQQMLHVPIQLMTEHIRTAQAQGDVRAGLDAAALAEICMATIIGMDQMSDTLTGGTDLRRRAEDFLEFFLSAVRPR
jgi:AcrR family transcriptional regulator